MKKYLLDTNFIYSLVDPSDSNNSKAKEIMGNISKEPNSLLIPYIVMAELIITSKSYDFFGLAKDLNSRIYLNTLNDLHFIDQHIPKRSSRSLKANDCSILALCYRHNARLLSFDSKLLKAYEVLIQKNIKD